jgi:hypothetical protein
MHAHRKLSRVVWSHASKAVQRCAERLIQQEETMTNPRQRAEQLFSNAETKRKTADSRDAAFFALRRAQAAANQEKTERLRALRLAHEATLPKPVKRSPRTRNGT